MPRRAEADVTWFGVTVGAWFRIHVVTLTEIRGMRKRIRGPARNSSRLAPTRTSSTVNARDPDAPSVSSIIPRRGILGWPDMARYLQRA